MPSIIVNIVDPECKSQPAIIAARSSVPKDTQVYLFHNAPLGNPVVGEAESELERHADQLDQLGERYFSGRVSSICVSVSEGWKELLEQVERHGCHTVFTSKEPASPLHKLGFANDDWDLIRHCPVPLLVANSHSTKHYKKVLAAIDPLHDDDKPASLDKEILRLAGAYSQHHGSDLEVLNVVLKSLPDVVDPYSPVKDLNEQLTAAHKDKVNELTANLEPPVKQKHLLSGLPQEEILKFVIREETDLIVLGAVSRSILKRLFIGSTAEKILEEIPCDMLIVKPMQPTDAASD